VDYVTTPWPEPALAYLLRWNPISTLQSAESCFERVVTRLASRCPFVCQLHSHRIETILVVFITFLGSHTETYSARRVLGSSSRLQRRRCTYGS
jgi:hypothetical protein